MPASSILKRLRPPPTTGSVACSRWPARERAIRAFSKAPTGRPPTTSPITTNSAARNSEAERAHHAAALVLDDIGAAQPFQRLLGILVAECGSTLVIGLCGR